MLLGVIVLVGAGVTRRWLLRDAAAAGATDPHDRAAGEATTARGADPRIRRPLRVAACLGALAVAVFGAFDLYTALAAVMGSVDGELLRSYATSSRHGRLTLARVVPLLALTGLALAPLGTGAARRIGTLLWGVAAVALLWLVSAVSHAAAVPGPLPIPADFVHLAAASSWAGALLFVAFLPLWTPERRDALLPAMERLSRIGLLAVLALFVTGVYGAQLHIGEPVSLVTTVYGTALIGKVALVLVIVTLAALNRWRLLPALREGGPTDRFRRALRIEAVLLLAVLAATAWLTTRPMPH